jgi:hypothetical protein
MSHMMKFWEIVIEHCLKKLIIIFKNQFGFMPGKSTMEAIFLIKQLILRTKERSTYDIY